MADIKKAYTELKKSYKLPDFAQLNNDFEISTIENEEFLLREVLKKIDDRMEAFVKILNSILEPETNLCDLHQCKAFDDDEKGRIFELYKKLMVFHNSALIVSIEADDKAIAGLISEIYTDWGNAKKQMIDILKKTRASWKVDVDIKEELGYLG